MNNKRTGLLLAVICAVFTFLASTLPFPTCAHAEEKARVLVLPFTINAPNTMNTLARDVPELIRKSLTAKGFQVVQVQAPPTPVSDAAAARALGRTARADYVVYGTLNQIGESFSIDARLAQVGGNGLRPYYLERPNILELAPAVDTLTASMSQGIVSKNALAEIEVRGTHILDPFVIIDRAQSRKGEPINIDVIDADVRRIWDLGYFEDVTASVEDGSKGITLVFTVVEKPRIDDIRVEGSKAVRLKTITEAMSTQTGSVLNEKLLAQDIQKITELYRKKGYYLADVKYEIQRQPGNPSAALVFTVDEGSKMYIKEVVIEGLEQVKRKDLEDYLAQKPRGMLSWLLGTGVLQEEQLERDSQAIQAYLVDNGFIEAQVSAPEVKYDPDGIRIIYTVREGPRYKLGDITFAGDLIVPDEVLYQTIGLDEHKTDQTYFSLQTMQKDVENLTLLYTDYGFAFAQVDAQNRVDAENTTIDIVYTLDPREKVYVRRVELEGNYRTRDNVIYRELRLADGQEFSGFALRRTSERLEKTGYFKTAETQIVPTGVPGEVDILVKVEEDNTGMIMGGVGYSTYDKFGVMASISENNLFGRGYNVQLRGYLSGRENSLNFSFTNPRIWDSNLGFSARAYLMEEEWIDFNKRTVGGTAQLFYPIGEYTTIGGGYRLDFYKIYKVSPYAAPSIWDYRGNNIASVVNLSISRDSTNSYFNPTRGTKASLFLSYGGNILGGSDNFVKVAGELAFFYGLSDTHVLHARGSAGAVFKNTKKPVPSFERYYIGGISSIRGYSYEDLSPRDPRTGEQIGADRMAYANFEYIWHFQPEFGLALVPFFDVGMSGDSSQPKTMKKLYYSTGLELRWRSPMGDLRFAYGFPLAPNVDGKSRKAGRFEFTMGQAF